MRKMLILLIIAAALGCAPARIASPSPEYQVITLMFANAGPQEVIGPYVTIHSNGKAILSIDEDYRELSISQKDLQEALNLAQDSALRELLKSESKPHDEGQHYHLVISDGSSKQQYLLYCGDISPNLEKKLSALLELFEKIFGNNVKKMGVERCV